ncbi:putative transcriptional regulator [Janibacter sp. HTCC2649]|uniref:ArsR/SmtB family transcription factor n=1 Tax=Janibacter sp. HTCC2649 TaxID=313589 RepID=UPI0000671194|nr:putative transcriptional regulator [Janibacter sp. HTCC2649]
MMNTQTTGRDDMTTSATTKASARAHENLLEAAPCCGITTPGGLTREQAETNAQLLKAVADPVRLRLLSIIRDSTGGEACVCDLTPAVGLAQPTVSHHLKVLTEAGLIEREKRGTWAWFRVIPSRLDDVRSIFS